MNSYSKVGWTNNSGTPLNATNLNKMDDQILEVTNTLAELIRTGVSPEAIIAAVNDYFEEHPATDDRIFEIIDIVFSETQSNVCPLLTIMQHNDAHWLTYVDSENNAHYLYDLTALIDSRIQAALGQGGN